MLINLSLLLILIASSLYLIALLPIPKIDPYRKKLGFSALILGMLHASLMIWAKNLSLLELSTYQKCLPVVSLMVALTLISYFYSKISFILKLIAQKKLEFDN